MNYPTRSADVLLLASVACLPATSSVAAPAQPGTAAPRAAAVQIIDNGPRQTRVIEVSAAAQRRRVNNPHTPDDRDPRLTWH